MVNKPSQYDIALSAALRLAGAKVAGCEMSVERAIALAMLEAGQVRIEPVSTPFLEMLRKG